MTYPHALSLLMVLTSLSSSEFIVAPATVQGLEETATDAVRRWPEFANRQFRFQPAEGIGREMDVTRRDVSDVIRVGGTYYPYLIRYEVDLKVPPPAN
jgi:hypothetical protein